MKKRIIGPLAASPDGYGEMTRQFILGMIESGYTDITLVDAFPHNNKNISAIKRDYDVLSPFINNGDDYDTNIIMLTANHFPIFSENGKKNVGITMWETDKLPHRWTDWCNQLDLLIVPATSNEKTFRDSGVRVPIKMIPIPTDVHKFDNIAVDENFAGELAGNFVFYSIFQWGQRKNPAALLNSYYSAFGNEDDVYLILKTHLTGSDTDSIIIEKDIKEIRNNIKRNNNDYPKIMIIASPLSDENICQIHKVSDCYLAPVRGEGFGMPIFDAALCGNHVIATNWSSHIDFIDTYPLLKHRIFDLIDYQFEYVAGESNPLYTADQKWASVNKYEFAKAMKAMYNKWKQNGSIGDELIRDDYTNIMKEKYDRRKIGRMLIEMVNEI